MTGKRTRIKRAIKVRRKNLKDRRAARAEKKASSRRVTRVDGRRSSAPGKPSFVRFAASSFTCTVVDQALAWFLFAALRRPFAGAGFIRILVSNVLARCVSLSLNFVLNRRLVFVPDEDGRRPRKRAEVEVRGEGGERLESGGYAHTGDVVFLFFQQAPGFFQTYVFQFDLKSKFYETYLKPRY